MRFISLAALFALLTVPAEAAPDPVAEAAYVRGDDAGAVAAAARADDALAAATDSTFEAAIQEKSRQLKAAIDAGPEAEKAFLARRR